MHRRFWLTISLVVIVLAAALAVPTAASAGSGVVCIGFSVTLRNDSTEPHTATVFYANLVDSSPLSPTATLTLNPRETGVLRLFANVPTDVDFYLAGGPGGLTILGADYFGDVAPASDCDGGRIGDGRLNDGANQLAAPVAVYCLDGNIDVYRIDPETAQGSLVIREPQVSGQPESGTNTILASSQGVFLSWLANGRYQIDTVNDEGKPYIITWNGCDPDSLERIESQP